MSAPEFSLVVKLDRLTAAPARFTIEAGADARAALARRFSLLEIGRLVADLQVRRTPKGAHAEGHFEADVVQACVVSGLPVAAGVSGPVDLGFQPLDAQSGDIELADDALDVVLFSGSEIDLGEAVSETLLLALDPYPRASESMLAEVRALLISEEEAARRLEADRFAQNPFAKLKP